MYQEPSCVRRSVTCHSRNVTITCPDRYMQPSGSPVPPFPARNLGQPAETRSSQPVKRLSGCADEDEGSSLAAALQRSRRLHDCK
jgi:hypothetical protein